MLHPARVRILLLLLLLLSFAHLANAAVVKEIRLSEFEGATRLVVELDSEPSYMVSNQSASGGQVTVELHNVTSSPTTPRQFGNPALVNETSIRLTTDERRLRIRLTTTGPVSIADQVLASPTRLVVDLTRGSGRRGAEIVASKPEPAPRYVAPPEAQPQSRPAPNGAWRKKIVIDPGHGGSHKGAIGQVGRRTVYEKEVTMQVAFRLERLLQADPRFDVGLTRRTDAYLGLQERTEIAAQLKGALFVSLHCNAVEGKSQTARGFEIWTWNRDSNTSAAARAISRMENDDPGVTRNNNRILTTMMTDALASQSLVSRRLAKAVSEAVTADPYFRKYDRGVHSARFKVLENYDMPSILVEMGFLTHTEEAKLLVDDAFQQRMARLLYSGIVSYYETTDPRFPRGPNANSLTARAK